MQSSVYLKFTNAAPVEFVLALIPRNKSDVSFDVTNTTKSHEGKQAKYMQ